MTQEAVSSCLGIGQMVRLHPESQPFNEKDHGQGFIQQQATFLDIDGAEYVENYVVWEDGHAAWYCDWELYTDRPMVMQDAGQGDNE